MVAFAFSPDGPLAFTVTVTVSPILTLPDDTETDVDPLAANTVCGTPTTPNVRLSAIIIIAIFFFISALPILPLTDQSVRFPVYVFVK